MKPSNGEHIISHIKDTLEEHRPELLKAIEDGHIRLITRRQIEMKNPAGFEALVYDYVDRYDMKWKHAYNLVESEHRSVYGHRMHTGYKSFMNSKYQREKIQ